MTNHHQDHGTSNANRQEGSRPVNERLKFRERPRFGPVTSVAGLVSANVEVAMVVVECRAFGVTDLVIGRMRVVISVNVAHVTHQVGDDVRTVTEPEINDVVRVKQLVS